MQFEAHLIGGIDSNLIDQLRLNKSLEFLWGIDSGHKNGYMFTSVVYSNGTALLETLMASKFEDLGHKISNELLIHSIEISRYYKSNHILIPIPCKDVLNSIVLFERLDMVIKQINRHHSDHAVAYYSTPNCYIKAINSDEMNWPRQTDIDFFPYKKPGNNGDIMNGFYTSRPSLKELISYSNGFLQSAKIMIAITGNYSLENNIRPLIAQVSLAQHHKIITGTSTQTVADAYVKILNKGLTTATKSLKLAYQGLLHQCSIEEKRLNNLIVDLYHYHTNKTDISDLSIVTIFNPIGCTHDHIFRFPAKNSNYIVYNAANKKIETQVKNIRFNYLN